MRHLTLTENAPARPVDLAWQEAEVLGRLELAVVTRAPGADTWEVAAGSKIGVACLGDLQVTIKPKIGIDRLVFMMGYTQDSRFWRDQTVLLDAECALPEALAHAFRRLAAKALEQGLLQGYKTVDESLPVLRGRVRVGDQIARRLGVKLPLEVTFDEFTTDIAENQILLAAALRLLRLPSVPVSVRQGLQRLRFQLVAVSELVRGQVLPAWTPSRLNARYQPALRLAALLLLGQSFEQRVGDLRVSGFVFDMWKIYEKFVSVALAEALMPFGGRSSLQPSIHLDEGRRVPMQPDFLWTSPGGRQVVIDAKYKAESPAGFPQADLYQLLAYCTVLEVPDGHLIYAKGNEEEQTYAVRGSDVTIHCHTLDLGQPPAQLLAQISQLASRLAAGVASPSH